MAVFLKYNLIYNNIVLFLELGFVKKKKRIIIKKIKCSYFVNKIIIILYCVVAVRNIIGRQSLLYSLNNGVDRSFVRIIFYSFIGNKNIFLIYYCLYVFVTLRRCWVSWFSLYFKIWILYKTSLLKSTNSI